MGFQAYEDVINLPLLWQMKDLVFRIAKKCCQGQIMLFGNRTEQSMEEAYQLRYPGEVLERYRERCGDTPENMRALAIALAECKEFLEDNMFVGNQKEAFISRLRSLSGSDIYLCGALYVLTDRKAEQKKLEEKLLEYAPHTSQEFIYLQSVLLVWLPGYETDLGQWNRFLGIDRTMTAYGNQRIYAWFLNRFLQQIKGYRKKDGEVIKALAQFPFHHVKEENAYWERLRKAGYSGQEIIFLNMNLPFLSESPNHLYSDSIVMERIVAQGCRDILNAEKVESPLLFEEVKRFLSMYSKFPIRLEGAKGLKELLQYRVNLKDAEMFLYFYQRKEDHIIDEKWFLVDLTKERWDRLAEVFSTELYTDLFEDCFCSLAQGQEDAWLEKYEKLCGEPYYNMLWKPQKIYTDHVFRNLVRAGKIDLVSHLMQYAKERSEADPQAVEEKWQYILMLISKKAQWIDCYEVFRFWEAYEQLYGLEALRKFLGDQDTISDNVGFYTFSRESKKFWQKLEFLSVEDQRKVFYWECDELYRHDPEYYNQFLLEFLLKKGIDLFPKEQCREIAEVLLADLSESSYDARRLRTLYYTDEELAAYEAKENQKKKESEERQMQEKRENWRKELRKGMDAENRTLSPLSIIGKNATSYNPKEYYEIAYYFVKEELEKGDCRLENRQLNSFLELLGTMVMKKVTKWDDVCRMIQKLEVVEDGSASD